MFIIFGREEEMLPKAQWLDFKEFSFPFSLVLALALSFSKPQHFQIQIAEDYTAEHDEINKKGGRGQMTSLYTFMMPFYI